MLDFASFQSSPEPLVQVLGHTLWQATLVAIMVGMALRLLPARRAELRYGIAAVGLSLVVLAAFTTWSLLSLNPVVPDELGLATTSRTTSVERSSAEFRSMEMRSLPQTVPDVGPPSVIERHAIPTNESFLARHHRTIATWLSIGWILGATTLLVRGLAAVATVRRWATTPIHDQPEALEQLQSIVRELSSRLGLRRVVTLAISSRISIPAVIGTFWPTILIPAAMLSGVPVEQWRIVIAHELAHVRRWDALVGIAQMVVESLLFFNPAVWWISRQLRIEREACCDAVAVRLCGQPLSVARTLVEVAAAAFALPPSPETSALMAFAEPTPRGELTDRVERLVEPDRTPRSQISWPGLGMVLILIVLLAGVLKWSSDLAVKAAASWMTPKERVDALVQLEADRNNNFAPAVGADSESEFRLASIPTQDPESAAGRIPVELIVRMDDGSLVEPTLQLISRADTRSCFTSSDIKGPQQPVTEYRRKLYFPPCHFYIEARHPGRADTASNRLMILPNDAGKTLEIVLVKGEFVPVLLQDASHRPIAHGFVRVTLPISSSVTQELESNEEGRLELKHVPPATEEIEILAPGFQWQKFPHDFGRAGQRYSLEKPYVITLKPARPVSIKVVDATTKTAVKNVRLRLWHRSKSPGPTGVLTASSRKYCTPDHFTDYATTDEAGSAILNQLEDNSFYTFVALADGYATAYFRVNAGEAEKTILLTRSLTLSGHVAGSMERLRSLQCEGKVVYQLHVTRVSDQDPLSSGTSGQSIQGEGQSVELDDDGRFLVDDLNPGERVFLNIPGDNRQFVMRESIANLEFEIPPAMATTPVDRDVIIRLTGIEPTAPARGKLYVSWRYGAESQTQPKGEDLDLSIHENEVRFKSVVGARIHVFTQNVIGYLLDNQNDIVVTEGTEPQLITALARPAGGIQGSILSHDGKPTDPASVTVFAIKRPAGETDDRHIDSTSTSNAASQFLCTVPMGGRYRVFAWQQRESSTLWGVSDEVTVDRTNPIAHATIQFPKGRDLSVRVLNPQGQPVIGQPVKLMLEFSTPISSTHSFTLEAASTSEGLATFPSLAFDHSIAPLNSHYRLVIEPTTYCGWNQVIDPKIVTEIRLKAGVSASGILVDEARHKPLPNTQVTIRPKVLSQATDKTFRTTTTDNNGQFQFNGLDQITYTGTVEGFSATDPPSFELTGGSKHSVQWKATNHSGR